MGIFSHFKRKEEKQSSPKSNAEQDSSQKQDVEHSESNNDLVLLYLGETELASTISSITLVAHSFERIFKTLDELIKRHKIITGSEFYLRQLLKAVTEKVFERLPAEPFEQIPEYEFMQEYISALYCICTENHLDFSSLFDLIKDLPTCVPGHEWEAEIYPWSFGNFTQIFDGQFYHLVSQSEETEDTINTINGIFLDYFEEFLENAGPYDIDELYKFGARFENTTGSMFEIVADALENNSFKTPHSAFPSIFTADALAEAYPSLTVEIYTYYIKYILNYAIEADARSGLIDGDYDLVRENLIEAFLAVKTLKDYRAEDFSELARIWDWILTIVLTSFDGVTLNHTIDFLQSTLKISKKEIMNQVIQFFSTYIFDSEGNYKVLTPNDIDTLASFLTSKDVFTFILRNRPSVIEVLS